MREFFFSKILIIIAIYLIVSFIYKSNNENQSIEVIFNYPVIFKIDSTKVHYSNLTDSIQISYLKDYTIYRLLATRKLETDEKIKGTEPYFVCRVKQNYGLFFKTINDTISLAKYNVDSFLLKQNAKGEFINAPEDTSWSFISEEKISTDILLKKYAVKHSKELTPDSLYYYFSNDLKNIPFSFSTIIDQTEHQKLCKVRLLFNEGYSDSMQIALPKREIFFEIRKLSFVDSEKLEKLIINFEREYPRK